MNKTSVWIVIVVIALLVIGILVYGRSGTPADQPANTVDQYGTPPPAVQPTQPPSATPPPSAGDTQPRTVAYTVDGKNFAFMPSTLTVRKGDTVRITFVNTGGFHDLRIQGYNVGTKQFNAGGQETIEFTADKAGTFEYYCSVGNHRAMGMKGTLTVRE